MKKKLLAGAAMAIAIGCTAAIAQEGSQGNGAGNSPGGAQHRLSPGGTGGAGGAMRNNQASPGGSAERNQAIPEKEGMGPPKGSNKQRSSSTRQRGAEENGKEQRGAEGNHGTNMQRGAEENHGTNMQRGTENERGGAMRENRENNARIQERGGAGNAGGKSVQLSESKRARIKKLIVKDRSVARANDSHFSVAVGTAVPHDVHVAQLPSDVIRVVPEYKGFDYVVVRDQLLIIDPDTMKIVAILPA